MTLFQIEESCPETIYLFMEQQENCSHETWHMHIEIIVNPFSTNVPIMDKAGSWFLLPKCLKNTCGSVTF